MTTKLCLIDSRINDYNIFINSIQAEVFYVLIDYQNDTFASLLNKIQQLQLSNIDSIAYIAHASFNLTYSFFNNVNLDMNNQLEWQPFFNFLISLNPKYFDFLACSLASDTQWKQVFDWTKNVTGVTIRASLDNTGNLAQGANWLLEDGNVDAKALYFTDNIQQYISLIQK